MIKYLLKDTKVINKGVSNIVTAHLGGAPITLIESKMKYLLITTIAVMLLVGCGKSQESSTPEVKLAEPVAELPAQQSTLPEPAIGIRDPRHRLAGNRLRAPRVNGNCQQGNQNQTES